MKNKFWFIQLFLILLLTIATSCKKDEVVIKYPSGSILFNQNLTYGQMIDQDGNSYKTIEIGPQTWMAENLRTTKYRNGFPIANITENQPWITATIGAYCKYDLIKNIDTIDLYGKLYNWFAISDSRNIAPEGWHVPTDNEFNDLITFLGGSDMAGGKMKESGILNWLAPNNDASNSSGFTALPSGSRGDWDGSFNFIGENSFFWSNTQYDSYTAWCYSLSFNDANFKGSYGWNKHSGASVRLVKD